jgi:glyoxylase-like metal-dependent hydrolase (beta-lactamase superfamily II)/rhodanese-related sulfurtransferase
MANACTDAIHPGCNDVRPFLIQEVARPRHRVYRERPELLSEHRHVGRARAAVVRCAAQEQEINTTGSPTPISVTITVSAGASGTPKLCVLSARIMRARSHIATSVRAEGRAIPRWRWVVAMTTPTAIAAMTEVTSVWVATGTTSPSAATNQTRGPRPRNVANRTFALQPRFYLVFSARPRETECMSKTGAREIPAAELARRLDSGERVQLLDVRSPASVARGHITFGTGLAFHALPASQIERSPSPDALGVDPRQELLVVCGHGNSSKRTAALLRQRGLDACSVTGGMAAWNAVYLPRSLSPTRTLDHVVQLDRVGKGALSYVLASDSDAVVVDPGRHLERYEAVLDGIHATPAAVIDTHMHADYLSGARAAARRWGVPYFLHPDDARSPFDAAEGRFDYQPLARGDTIAFGRATLRAEHVPGHTLGSVALLAEQSLALTGDFLFVQSVGRPDLGGQGDAWARMLWRSLEDVRGRWPPDLLVFPAHYASELERRPDRSVGARLDVILATNPAAAIVDEATFLRWVAEHDATPPEVYRTIKLANLGLHDLPEADVEATEAGPNQCAVGAG